MTNKNIHLIGVCGVAMGSLAQMFKEEGYVVSGSDANMYPPMSTILKDSGITLHETFDENNVMSSDLVIVCNAISRGNVEVEYVLNNKIPYMSMAQALYSFFFSNKEIIAVSGTHGKTTTSALLAHIACSDDADPTFFVGGVLKNYNTNYKIGSGKFAIIEADEYDSAFFEKVPKFMLYRPDHLVVTSLEFDHADIYGSIEEIELWFKRLVNIIPSRGTIIYSNEYPNLTDIVKIGHTKKSDYGDNGAITYTYMGSKQHYAQLKITTSDHTVEVKTPLLGKFNYNNITAAVGMALSLGMSYKAIQVGVESFQGVKRRQELIYSDRNKKIYEDFAHHPRAIEYAISAFRDRFKDANLWVLYEPRSATSRRNTFQDKLPNAFMAADNVVIKTPFTMNKIPVAERLDVKKLVYDINALNKNCEIYDKVEDIVTTVTNKLPKDKESVILILSNGSFDGIYSKLVASVSSPDRK